VITGRGPGAPGVTSDAEFTRGRVTAGNPGDGAIDLGEIRWSEEIINVLAARAATPAGMRHDPAVALLSALAADIDAVPGPLARTRESLPGRRRSASGRRRTVSGRGRTASGHRRSLSAVRPVRRPAHQIDWARPGAVGAVAGVAGALSVVAAGMLARLRTDLRRTH
jgi:hypothetical protein